MLEIKKKYKSWDDLLELLFEQTSTDQDELEGVVNDVFLSMSNKGFLYFCSTAPDDVDWTRFSDNADHKSSPIDLVEWIVRDYVSEVLIPNWIESRKLKEVPDMWMNIHTGTVSPMGHWDDFEYWRDAGSLVEVRKSTTEQEKEEYGEWTPLVIPKRS